MSNYDVIRDAIRNKHQIVASYKGYDRELCPHVIGTNKEGREQCLCYQFGGHSSSGLSPPGSDDNWRCMAIGALSEVRSRPGPWCTASNHSRPQKCVAHIDVEVAY